AKAPVLELVDGLEVSEPTMSLWSNVDGHLVNSGPEFVQSLVSQISNPVRWDKCMDSLTGSSATVLELPPAGALAGLIKRGVPDATAIALKNPADLEKVPNS
ncbi:MAG: ACP S-malonyltransferase, partial [Aquiluna sp.]